MDLIRVSSDKEKARSILKMTDLLGERIKKSDRKKMTALIITDYYEIIKELITAVLLLDGYKTLSHKNLIEYLKEKYSEFDSHMVSILNNLRVLTNRVCYDGFFI
jgi:ABC-type multidrug transport system ATPase subunit